MPGLLPVLNPVKMTLARKEIFVTNDDRIAQLEKQLEYLSNRLGIAEDILAIRNLQHKYGYSMDKGFYEAGLER